MNENNKSNTTERRERRRKALCCPYTQSSYAYSCYFNYNPHCRLQISRSIGLEDKCGHRDIQMLIALDDDENQHKVLEKILDSIENGKRYKAGDRVTVNCKNSSVRQCVVEFREAEDYYGKCLRAVVLDIEEEFQSLPTEKAFECLDRLRNAQRFLVNLK